MKVLLTGATGFVGRNLLQGLQRDGHQVVAIARRYGADFLTMQSAETWLPWLDGVDAVINAVGIIGETGAQHFDVVHHLAPVALFDACLRAGVRRVIQISALGADEQAFSAYHLSKRAADGHLRCMELEWFVVRPALIYGRGGVSNDLFQRLARLPVLAVIGRGDQALQPIHIADVAATVQRCLVSTQVRLTLDAVGPERMPYLGWLKQLRAAQGLAPAPVVHVPVRLAQGIMALARPLSPMFRAENIRMLMAGNVADGQPWEDFMGRAPIAFTPAMLSADATDALIRFEG